MKTPSAELHQLVHSLSQNEKRYFMMQGGAGTRLYQEFFRLVNSQEVYDEPKIRGQMQMKNAHKFKKLKHYTFQNSPLNILAAMGAAKTSTAISGLWGALMMLLMSRHIGLVQPRLKVRSFLMRVWLKQLL